MQASKINSSNLLIQTLPKVQHNERSTIVGLQTHQDSFQNILNKTIDDNSKLQFSKHASMRLKSRDIKFSNEQMERIENGVTKAKAKGIKDSLVLVDNIVLVVNIRKNIVITAMEQTQNDENIYTNIDGAVIV